MEMLNERQVTHINTENGKSLGQKEASRWYANSFGQIDIS